MSESKEKVKEVINLKDRVEVELIADLPSMRKYKGDIIKTHPKNVNKLIEKKIIKKP